VLLNLFCFMQEEATPVVRVNGRLSTVGAATGSWEPVICSTPPVGGPAYGRRMKTVFTRYELYPEVGFIMEREPRNKHFQAFYGFISGSIFREQVIEVAVVN